MGATIHSDGSVFRARRDRDSRTQQLLLDAGNAATETERQRLLDEVVLLNRTMATGLARQFDYRGVERDDLYQVAMLGLVQAARRYRPGVGSSFASFAVPTIRGVLKRHFRDRCWAVRPPRALQDLNSDVRSCSMRLEQSLMREPTDGEVADELQVPLDKVRYARTVEQHYRTSSLDSPVRGEVGTALRDTLCDESDGPCDQAMSRLQLQEAMRQLTRQEQMLLQMRFVEDLTQREIGMRMNVSQMQVSRLLKRILTRMRSSMQASAHA